MSERQGLVGALPAGERWRAQGYVGGMHKYLGTFDSEEEAHHVFLRARDAAEAERRAEAEREVDRILSGPTLEYRGGVGRGAVHNGRRFKVVEARGAHQAIVVPMTTDGLLDFAGQTTVTTAYLYEVTEMPEPVEVTHTPSTEKEREIEGFESLDIDALMSKCAETRVPDREPKDLGEDLLRFIARREGQDVLWALEFVAQHASGNAARIFDILLGKAGLKAQIDWLRANTTISSEMLNDAEVRSISNFSVTPKIRREVEAVSKVFPESFSRDDIPKNQWFRDE